MGGIFEQKQLRLLKKNPEIVVATPGRLWDLMQQVGHNNNNKVVFQTNFYTQYSVMLKHRYNYNAKNNIKLNTVPIDTIFEASVGRILTMLK